MERWQTEHKLVIESFLDFLNQRSSRYVLKGGTALMECYGLDRFSEDIDLDGSGSEISSIVHDFCALNGYTFRDAKDTDTVKRFMIHYNEANKPLKIEVSARRRQIPEAEVASVNGIRVYIIDTLAHMKSNAYMGRDKIRDLYDVTFICNHYYDALSEKTKMVMQDAVANKGVEQFDHIVSNQQDTLIDIDKLAESFLEMYEKLGLLVSEEEKQEIQDRPDHSQQTESNNGTFSPQQYFHDDPEL